MPGKQRARDVARKSVFRPWRQESWEALYLYSLVVTILNFVGITESPTKKGYPYFGLNGLWFIHLTRIAGI